MRVKRLPDGTVELEGDPEEIEEYERRQRESGFDDGVREDRRGGKRLLTEEELKAAFSDPEFRRELDDAVERVMHEQWYGSDPALQAYPVWYVDGTSRQLTS